MGSIFCPITARIRLKAAAAEEAVTEFGINGVDAEQLALVITSDEPLARDQ